MESVIAETGFSGFHFVDEALQSLDKVRRLMETGVLHSAYWHRF